MKTKANRSVITITLFLITCGLAASAQDQVTPQPASSAVPNLIRYSGLLKDSNNAPLASQTVGVIFSLYKDAAGGAAVWSETRNLTTTATGQYTVLLGSTKTEGLPAALFSEQEQRWLGVQVQGQSEQPRVLLVSVPYAFKAHEAETLGGLPASAFVKAAPDATTAGSAAATTGTSVNAPSTAANGTANSGNPPSVLALVNNTPCGSSSNPTVLYIPIFTGSAVPANVICNSVIYQTPLGALGNVGINTISPGAKLDVNGEVNARIWYDLGFPKARIVSVHNNPATIPSSTSTNLFLGWGTGTSNVGDFNENTFTGRDAGFSTNYGNDNTFTGFQAGRANTGKFVSFGPPDLAGSKNTFTGSQAGFTNTTGFFNTFTGWYAGYSNVGGADPLGSYNTFTGASAGDSNTTGYYNAFFGYRAGLGNTTGHSNTCIGFQTCLQNSVFTGAFNTHIGRSTGYNSAGSYNTLLGAVAGYNMAGNYNTVSGHLAGFNLNDSGSYNIYTGWKAGSNNTTGSSDIYISNLGIGAESNAIRIGTEGSANGQQRANTYIAGIVSNPQNLVHVVTVSTASGSASGHLGYRDIPLVSGNVTGPSTPCPTNFLTMWGGGYTTNCSIVYQQPGTNHIGIGTTTPSEALDVNGVINAWQWYDITPGQLPVLSIGIPTVSIARHDIFVGIGAGENGTPGRTVDNAFVGWNAGISNTGNQNTFSGSQAGPINRASGNSFFGYKSGNSNISGDQDAFFGANAGLNNSTGKANTFLAWGAGWQHIDGDQNTFVGTSAGFNDYHGKQNTFIGASAGQTNGSGVRNTYVGVGAGLFSAGSDNTSLGTNAGINNATGSSNVYLTNSGVNGDNGYIRIGTQGTGQGQQDLNTFIAGIFNNTSSFAGTPRQVVVDSTGHLGTASGGGGTGNVTGPGNCADNYLAKWLGGNNNINCSRVWENQTSPYFVGIGPTFQSGTPVSTRQLQVDGDIDEFDVGHPTGHYQIVGNTVLSIDPTLASNNIFVGVGAGADPSNTGSDNAYVGYQAGFNDKSGYGNVFSGYQAGYSNNQGQTNTYLGWLAGYTNDDSGENTFVGEAAGYLTHGGGENTFVGGYAGSQEVIGFHNTFVGYASGPARGTVGVMGGDNNIFVGANAGNFQQAPVGDNNIYIGNPGCPAGGLACAEQGIIRIGNELQAYFPKQTDTYIAGIYSKPVDSTTGTAVFIDSTGKLGTILSSRRFKEQIADMGDSTSSLMKLHPVTFFYKAEYDTGARALQYGLIAEEVAMIYPDMVVYEKDGSPLTVKYHLLAPMLLNEFQKQHAVVTAQQQLLETQGRKMLAQEQEIESLKSQLQLQNAAFQDRLSRLEKLVGTTLTSAAEQAPALAGNSQ